MAYTLPTTTHLTCESHLRLLIGDPTNPVSLSQCLGLDAEEHMALHRQVPRRYHGAAQLATHVVPRRYCHPGVDSQDSCQLIFDAVCEACQTALFNGC